MNAEGGHYMRKTIAATVILICCFLTIEAQTINPEAKPKAVIVPEEIYLPIRVPQSDCPLQFEKTLIVKYLDQRPDELFQVRNVGGMSIKSFTYITLTSTDLGGMYSKQPENPILNRYLFPM